MLATVEMHTEKLGGRLNLYDPASGQAVCTMLTGTFSFQVQGDPSGWGDFTQKALVRATEEVLVQKLQANQVALPTLQASLPHFHQEIIAAAGMQSHGVHVSALQLQVSVQAPSAAHPHVGALPPTPAQATANALQQSVQDQLDPRNYEVEGRANVAGYNVRVSTDGGLDTAGLVNQAKSKAIWWLVFAGAGLLVLLLVAGVGWYAWRQTVAKMDGEGSQQKGDKWDGKSPFTCGGNDKITIKDVTAELDSGTAITAGSNCQLTLQDVEISAPTAISAIGKAKVTVKGGKITGSKFAAKALGEARVTFKDAEVDGKTQAVGKKAKITGP